MERSHLARPPQFVDVLSEGLEKGSDLRGKEYGCKGGIGSVENKEIMYYVSYVCFHSVCVCVF